MTTSTDIAVAVISSAGLTGLVSGLVSFVKDRKKDAATAKLTDVQALQQQVSLMDSVTKFLRAENERLQADYNASEAARRAMRAEIMALQDELAKVQYKAAQTQQQCDRLSSQLQALIAKGND
jgi:ABC-type phosphate transport system auxiliary subunit